MSRVDPRNRLLSASLLATEWVVSELAMTCRRALIPRHRAPVTVTRTFAFALVEAFPDRPDGRPRELTRWVDRYVSSSEPPIELRTERIRVTYTAGRMVRNRWSVPILHDLTDLAAMLSLTVGELRWFADTRAYQVRAEDEALHHYRYSWLPKSNGGHRLLESPKPRLKAAQRDLLRSIVALVPTHEAAHGFVTGRSALTATEQHAGKHVVLRFDLSDFFASVTAARIFAIFRTCGYPEAVAHVLTGLTTNRVPLHALRAAPLSPTVRTQVARLRTPHLPQGAPTSPALANLAAVGLDRRVEGLARRFGATYTRYADDLIISGGRELLRFSARFASLVDAIVTDEAFALNNAKTLVRTQSTRQSALGLVINERPNVSRRDFDVLKATLHNCITKGPATQHDPTESEGHFQAVLLGRIAWVDATNPSRGTRLRSLYDRVVWDDGR